MGMRRAAVVQYHTSVDSAEHNRSLIEEVLNELAARDPGGLDYQVFQFEDGRVANAQTSALEISKVGLEADLTGYARREPTLYAAASILVAIAAGWAAAALFRRA